MKWLTGFIPAAFALGFVIAWTSKPTRPIPTETPATSSRSSSLQTPTGASRHSPAHERAKGYLRQIDEAFKSRNSSDELLKNIPPSDIPFLYEQWSKRAGFTGLDFDEQYQIKKVMRGWYEKEPQTALEWVAGMEYQKDRQELISQFVAVEAKRNFEHALDLAKQYGKRELGGLDMPGEIEDRLSESDPARFMEILRAFPSDGSGSSGSSVAFKENFDFAELADLLENNREESEERSYSQFPTNFLEEWTKSDPDAAWHWISNKRAGHLPFNDVDEFFEALTLTRTTEQINTFLIDQMANREDEETKFKLAWKALAAKPDAGQIADFIARLPRDRGLVLEQLTKESKNGSGGHFDEFKNLLASQMTSEERKAILPKVFGEGISASERKKTVRTLKQLGHTEAEINGMLPAPNEE